MTAAPTHFQLSGRKAAVRCIPQGPKAYRRRAFIAALMFAGVLSYWTPAPAADNTSDWHNPRGVVIDYRSRLNPRFEKIERKTTRFLIVHTSECDQEETLKIVSMGKQEDGKWVSRGGHAHYVIAADGTTYRILDEKFKANHAGLSMWNGTTGLNHFAVGIELVGYHDADISGAQYETVRSLLKTLQRKYRLNDLNVLTHSQVAYARPNQWVPRNHRGRKYCAVNFDRTLAGLGPTWRQDPDVKSGRLAADPFLSAIFYNDTASAKTKRFFKILSRHTSAWAVAGRSYNSPDTLYRFPDGMVISGNRIAERVGWGAIPAGTIVYFE